MYFYTTSFYPIMSLFPPHLFDNSAYFWRFSFTPSPVTLPWLKIMLTQLLYESSFSLDSCLHFYSGPFKSNLNDNELLSESTCSHLENSKSIFLTYIFYLEDFLSSKTEKHSVCMTTVETSAVSTALSGPKEVDIFPALVCSITWVILCTHYHWWRTCKVELLHHSGSIS